jgi:hypothetical protein
MLIVVLVALMIPLADGRVVRPDRAKELRAEGYSTDTPEQIIEATKSESYYFRYIALELLTQRTGEKAIPTLKEALNDPRVEVRWQAAHWLGTLGDKSGLEQMRKDLKEFAPDSGAPVPPDPNVVDPYEMKEREGKRNDRLCDALEVARVLAELGDRRGFELATTMGLVGPWELQRYLAVWALVEMAKADKATLQAEGIDPILTLCVIAESEKNIDVFEVLTNLVAKNLDDDIAIRVLEIAKNSPNQSEEARRVAQINLDTVKDRKKTGGSKLKDSGGCCGQ